MNFDVGTSYFGCVTGSPLLKRSHRMTHLSLPILQTLLLWLLCLTYVIAVATLSSESLMYNRPSFLLDVDCYIF